MMVIVTILMQMLTRTKTIKCKTPNSNYKRIDMFKIHIRLSRKLVELPKHQRKVEIVITCLDAHHLMVGKSNSLKVQIAVM